MVTKVTEWNDVEKVLNGFGIALRDTAGTFKDADTIISELGENWQTYNSVQKNAIATAVAGTRQREVFYSTMENWEQVGKAARIAADSQGNAAQKMDAYTDSVEAAKNRITAAVEKLTMKINLEGMLKNFYKVTGGLIDNIGLISGALATYLFKFKGQSLFSGIFGDGKILNNSAYKLMDIGSGMNNQGSLRAAMKNYFGDQTIDGKTTNKFKEHVAEMAAMQAQMTTEKRFFGTGTTFNEQQQSTLRRGLSLQDGSDIFMNDTQVRNVMQSYISSAEEGNFLLDKENAVRSELINALATEEEKELIASGKISEEEYINITNRMASSLEGREKELKASMTRYITGLDENGVELTDEAANRAQYLAALQKGLTTEEKNQIVMNMLTDEQMEETRELAKKRVAETKMANATEEEIAELEEVAIAEERLKVALNQYAKAMEKASPEQRRIFAQHVNTKYDYETGMKSLRQGAVTTGFMTAGAVAPMVLSKGAGALGEKFGMDDSTSAIVSMLGMSGLGNIAGRNVKGISEGAAAFSKAAKSARLAASTINGANGLTGAFNAMSASAKAGMTALKGVEGAIPGIAAAGILIVGMIAMIAAQAHEKAKEARAEAYKEAKAQYDSIIDATATFNESRYSYLAAGVDQYGNNISLDNDEYEEFVETSNRLAEVFPDLVTYTDEAGNKFLNLGENAKEMGDAIDKATAAAQRARDEALLRTRGDEISNLKKQEGEIRNKYNTIAVQRGAANNTLSTLTSEERASMQKEIQDLYAGESDYFIAQVRESLGQDESGNNIYDQLEPAIQAAIQNVASSGLIDFTANDWESQVAAIGATMSSMTADQMEVLTNPEKSATAGEFGEIRSNLSNSILNQYGDPTEWEGWQMANAKAFGFDVINGQLVDTLDIMTKIQEAADGINLDNLGISDMTIQEAREVYTLIQEGVVSANTTKKQLQDIMNSEIMDGMSDKKLDEVKQARMHAAAKVTESEVADYMADIIDKGAEATVEETANRFPGIASDVAATITNEVNKGANSYAEGILTGTDRRGSNKGAKESVKQIKAEAKAYKQSRAEVAKYAKERKKAQTTINKLDKKEQKGKKLTKKETENYKEAEDTIKDTADAYAKAQKQMKKDGDKLAKNFKKQQGNIVKAVHAAQDSIDDVDLSKAQNAYQEFFSNIEDENGNKMLDTWGELKQGFAQVNDIITSTNNALDEQNQYGQLSVQTALELLSADENYIDVIDVKDGKLQLASNATEVMAKAQMEALKGQIEAQISSIEAENQKIEAILDGADATNGEVDAIIGKGKTELSAAQATDAATASEYALANGASVAAGSVVSLTNTMASAIPTINAYATAVANAGKGKKSSVKGFKTISTADVGSTTTYTNPNEGKTSPTADDLFDKNDQHNKDKVKSLKEKLAKNKQRIKDLKALGDSLDSVDSFVNAYEPGGGKSGGSGGGGGGSGDKYTRLDKVKDILDAINKEYLQMIAYDKKLATGNNINVAYYQKRKQYLKEEIELLQKKAKKDAKKSDMSDYYSDLKDLQQARIDLANLDDEKIQDKIDILEARKDLTGILYKQEIKLYRQLVKTADTEQERLEYQKKLLDAQKEQIESQKAITDAIKETISYENRLFASYNGQTSNLKKTNSGLMSQESDFNLTTVKNSDGTTVTVYNTAENLKKIKKFNASKAKYKIATTDNTGTLIYGTSSKSSAKARVAAAKNVTKANNSIKSDAINADYVGITDSFGNTVYYISSKINKKRAEAIKKAKKAGKWVAVRLDDNGELHYAIHSKTGKKYKTKKAAKKNLGKMAKQYADAANTTSLGQDYGGSQSEGSNRVAKSSPQKQAEKILKDLESGGKNVTASVHDIAEQTYEDLRETFVREMTLAQEALNTAITSKNQEEIEKAKQDIQQLEQDFKEQQQQRYQVQIDLIDAMGYQTDAAQDLYRSLLSSASTTEQEYEYQKQLNDAIKEYNSLLRDTLEYKYALYDNILEYESYTPSKDENSQYQKAIGAQQEILKKEMQDAKDQAEQYRKMAFDTLTKYYINEKGMSEAEAKDKAWKDSENDSDYQEAVNQYVEAFQKMGELVIRQFNDIADAIGRKLDKLEQERAEEWRSTWDSTWDNEGKLVTKAQDKIKAYYGSVQAMQEQIKTEALATLKDVTYLTDEQVQELVDAYNEAAVEIHQAMIDQMQDTVDYQDTLYNAVVDEVNDIIFNLEKQKELTEEMYDDEIESLQKKEDSIQRTNDFNWESVLSN